MEFACKPSRRFPIRHSRILITLSGVAVAVACLALASAITSGTAALALQWCLILVGTLLGLLSLGSLFVFVRRRDEDLAVPELETSESLRAAQLEQISARLARIECEQAETDRLLQAVAHVAASHELLQTSRQARARVDLARELERHRRIRNDGGPAADTMPGWQADGRADGIG